MAGTTLDQLSALLATPEPAELGPGPRAGVRQEKELGKAMDSILAASNLPPQRQELIRSLLFLWHDHLNAAHEIAQGVATPDGSFVHGIMHRREPDYGNAAYWFRRVGNHPAYPGILKRTRALATTPPNKLVLKQLTPADEWEPFQFIQLCEQAERSGSARPGE
jgi:hypothetical protein